jgi:hypothetical protein
MRSAIFTSAIIIQRHAFRIRRLCSPVSRGASNVASDAKPLTALAWIRNRKAELLIREQQIKTAVRRVEPRPSGRRTDGSSAVGSHANEVDDPVQSQSLSQTILLREHWNVSSAFAGRTPSDLPRALWRLRPPTSSSRAGAMTWVRLLRSQRSDRSSVRSVAVRNLHLRAFANAQIPRGMPMCDRRARLPRTSLR